MRRLAALRREIRSRSASFSRLSPPWLCNGSSSLFALRSGGGARLLGGGVRLLGGGVRGAAVPIRIGDCPCGAGGLGCTAIFH